MKLFAELKWRGLIDNITSPDLEEKLNQGGLTFYIGIDPTCDSLHIGHYSSLLVAKRLKDGGHNPIILVGGATGLIGDPKPNSERPMISKKELDYNYKMLSKQIKKIFDFELVNNYDWSKEINFIDYLRDYGKFFSVNYMLNKETVKKRLEIGITYTEFSYMIMQALDFLYLYENKNCTLQIGGQDQWGNITSGIELIRKKVDGMAYGLTMPLITKTDGEKFGKTEKGAIWLDKDKTSVYELYQFLINSEDDKVIEYLKKLTFLTYDEIMDLEQQVKKEAHLRNAQKELAKEIITFLYGEDEYKKAVKISESLFNGKLKELKVNEILLGLKDVPNFKIEEILNLVDFLVTYKICSSKREARELINMGAITINDDKIIDESLIINKSLGLDKQLIVVRRGKKNYFIGYFGDDLNG